MDDINLNGNTCQRAAIHPPELVAIAKVHFYLEYVHFSCDSGVEVIHQHFILSLGTVFYLQTG